MEKKQYDEIIEILRHESRANLADALSTTTGFELCQQIEQLRDDLGNTYKTITQLRGRVADLETRLEQAKQQCCSHATGKHDEECDLVAGLSVENMGLATELKEAREEVFDLYHQGCCVEISQDGTYARYDNQCMSAYEYAEEKLIEWGLVEPEQCLQRKK